MWFYFISKYILVEVQITNTSHPNVSLHAQKSSKFDQFLLMPYFIFENSWYISFVQTYYGDDFC